MSYRFDMSIRVLPDADAVAEYAAIHLLTRSMHAKHLEIRAPVALSGGTTPRRLFARLATFADLDHAPIDYFFGDERAVPPGDAESNYRAAREALFDPVGALPEQVHRIRGEDADLERAASQYEATIRERVPIESGGLPAFALIWLGMGADGHTASLFSDSPALAETERLVVATEDPKTGTRRVTMTLPLINAAREVQFLVTGAAKSPILREVFRQLSEDERDDMHPAARVRPANGTLEWVIDREAAAALF